MELVAATIMSCLAVTLAPVASPVGVPEDAVAVVNGEPLTEQDFHAFVGHEFQADDRARDLLELMIQQQVVQAEADRKGIKITDEDLDRRFRLLEQETLRNTSGKEDLQSIFRERGITREEFLPTFRTSLLAEELVRDEFGIRSGDEVPYEKTNVWIQDQLAKAKIKRGGQPEGVVIVVDGAPIYCADLGQRLLIDQKSRRREFLDEFVDSKVIRVAAGKDGLTPTADEIEHAIERQAESIRNNPRYGGATLDQLLSKTGRSIDWLRRSARLRNQLTMDRMVDARYPDGSLREFYEQNIEYFDNHYGPSVKLRLIFLRAGHEGARIQNFVPRLYEDADKELDSIRQRLEQGRADFEKAARSRSEHASSKNGGDIGYLARTHPQLGELAGAALDAGPTETLIGPIRTVDGSYLIEVLDRRPKPSFEQILNGVRKKAASDLFQEIKAAAQVEYGE